MLLLRKEGAASFVLLLFCFSLVFVRICLPDWHDPASDLDEEAIRQAFNEYASAVLSGDGDGDGDGDGNGKSKGNVDDVALKSAEIRSLFSRYGNLSHSEREAVAVWHLLRRAATRPDLFTQGKRAIAAAVSAWEEILHQVAEENNEENDHQGKSRRQCCYSVEWNHSNSNNNNNNNKRKKNKGLVLSIPCGLILDSSINLVAVPRGTFGIRLAGSNKTILHYQVRFSNKSSSIIVQSTAGGLQETCPSTAASSTSKVDGFEACFLRSSSSSSNSTNKQKQRLSWSTSVHSPFSLGLPFVASLWLGWHGFHATVNGRHVTSSRYHQEQEPEPWMVDTVEIDGRIDVYSLMATGLPAPENHKQPELEYLKAPTMSTPYVLLVGVSSTANNFDRRMAIRRSWMQYEAVRSGKVAVRFFVGLDKSSSVNSELWNEALAYKDIQLLPFIDQYELITLKTLAICIYGVKIARSHFLMKADDDTFVRVDEVLSLVKDADPKTGLLLGLIEPSAMPNRDKSSKWYIGEEEWPDPYYPPWAHGAGYLVSGEIGKHIVKSYEKSELKLFKLEDVAMGMWVVDYARLGKHVDYVNHDRFFNLECASGYVIAHYQKPKDMLCLWRQLQKGEGAVCC